MGSSFHYRSVDGKIETADFEEILMSADDDERLFGRAVDCGAAERMRQWVEAELNRGEKTSSVLLALVSLQAQIVSSLVIQHAKTPESAAEVNRCMTAHFESVLAAHLADIGPKIRGWNADQP